MIQREKILVTGATGNVARPIAESLARHNDVWCAARFSDPAAKADLEKAGLKTVKWELGSANFSTMPDDFTYVVHAAASILTLADDYDGAIACNAEGTGLLMHHCRSAKAFLHVSSLVVYKPPEHANDRADERTAPLGGNPSSAKTYNIMKIATEGVVRSMARAVNLPTTIARLGMVYGTSGHGGEPTLLLKRMMAGEPLLRSSQKRYYSPISEIDVVAEVEPLLNAASVPANIINWSSDEVMDREALYEYLSQLSGLKPVYMDEEPGWDSIGGLPDLTRLMAIAGPSRVKWREGILQTLKVNFPKFKFREPPQKNSP